MFRQASRCILALILVSAVNAQAAVIEFASILNGASETPPNASPGTGSAFVLFDDATKQLVWNLSFSGLLAPVTAAHIHTGAAGVAGPVAFGIDAASNPGVFVDGIGKTTGIFAGVSVLSLAQETSLFAGDLYFNLHTSAFPGGEIRGQILPGGVTVIPLPGALVLMVSAIGGFAGVRRLML